MKNNLALDEFTLCYGMYILLNTTEHSALFDIHGRENKQFKRATSSFSGICKKETINLWRC